MMQLGKFGHCRFLCYCLQYKLQSRFLTDVRVQWSWNCTHLCYWGPQEEQDLQVCVVLEYNVCVCVRTCECAACICVCMHTCGHLVSDFHSYFVTVWWWSRGFFLSTSAQSGVLRNSKFQAIYTASVHLDQMIILLLVSVYV